MTAAALLPALDADVGDAIAAGLLGPVPRDLAAFERAFMAAVESGDPDPERAWDRFYDATLARLAAGPDRAGTGTVSTFGRIWACARALSVGRSVLDVGACLGFLALAWAGRPDAPALVTADLSGPAAGLVQRQARRLGRRVAVLQTDGTALPLHDSAVDTVLLLHVLEHVDRAACERLLAEALRVAARRVVVAVPVEAVPDSRYGHVQVFDLADLHAVGRRTGWSTQAWEADGAWLVLDRPRPPGYMRSRPSWPDR